MHLRNLNGVVSFPKRSRDPNYAPFRKFFYSGVALAVVDPLTKFKERSFIYSRNTEGVQNFIKDRVAQTICPFQGKFFTPAALRLVS